MRRFLAGVRRLASRTTRRGIVYALAYSVLLSAPLALQHADDWLGLELCDDVPRALTLWYQRFTTLGYRTPRAHFVRLVTITPEIPGQFANPCERRAFIAKLLDRLQAIRPAMVVLNYPFLASTSCRETEDLVNAVQRLSSVAQVAVGRSSFTHADLEGDNDPDLGRLIAHGFSSDQQIVEDDVFAASSERCAQPIQPRPGVIMGLTRLDCDTRRVPLRWPVYHDKSCVLQRSNADADSLAFAVAAKWDPKVAVRVGTLLGHDPPFLSLLAESEFHPIHARDLFKDANADFGLRGRIVVVGEHSEEDSHRTVIGSMNGFVLQANYIEALLDDRYLKPLNGTIELCVTLLCLIVLRVIFDRFEPFGVALAYGAALVAVLLLVSYVAMVEWGFFAPLWPAALGAFIAHTVDGLLPTIKSRFKRRRGRHGEKGGQGKARQAGEHQIGEEEMNA